VAETASGADRDNEEHVETWRLTRRDYNPIQVINSIQCFCSYKVHNFYTTFQMPPGGEL
jgi:hypothetical protein